MNASSRKVLKEVWLTFLSQNWTEEGMGSEEEDAPEWRGFWDRADLRLGAIEAD